MDRRTQAELAAHAVAEARTAHDDARSAYLTAKAEGAPCDVDAARTRWNDTRDALEDAVTHAHETRMEADAEGFVPSASWGANDDGLAAQTYARAMSIKVRKVEALERIAVAVAAIAATIGEGGRHE